MRVILILLVVSCNTTPPGESSPDAGGIDPVTCDNICGTECCSDEQSCLVDRCVADCQAEKLCGANQELCCGDGEFCWGNECLPPGDTCEFTEECGLDEYCESLIGKCLPLATGDDKCEFVPPPGSFTPKIGCRWTADGLDYPSFNEVVMTPTVANLTDDNGDGKTDTKDIPDLVFTSFDYPADGCCTNKGVIRIVSGRCNADGDATTPATMTTIATLGGDPAMGSELWIDNSGGIALANLDPDSDSSALNPEIVANTRTGMIAYKRVTADGSQWQEFWRNDSHGSVGVQPSIADLNGDGSPEVIVGNVVLNGQTGVLIWDGKVTVGPNAGVGNNAFLGPVSTVADLDLDGSPEVIAGNTVYDGATGAHIWTYTYTDDAFPYCQGSKPCDGYNAVGNFDSDPEGDVVIVRQGEVFVLNHDGTELFRAPIPHDDCVKGTNRANESGPPTVADFDGDGRAEVGTAGADFYAVMDFDCVGANRPAECDQDDEFVLWKVPNRDCSSRATGSSVFDFEGDGAAEVVYADETSFRILSGADGTVLYEDTSHRSNTRMEMPIVVDVDNDGKSEVIVPEPNRNSAGDGIEIIEDTDNNWVRTRRIWNQHSYHVTNISEDGQVPRVEPTNWNNPRLNNFRQNVQPDGLFNAPDLVITDIRVEQCLRGAIVFAVDIINEGSVGVSDGIPLMGQVKDQQGAILETVVLQTSKYLLPSQRDTILVSMGEHSGDLSVAAFIDDDGMGGAVYNECDETNNSFETTLPGCGID